MKLKLNLAFFVIALVSGKDCFAAPAAASRIETDLTGPGWRLWLDREANWEGDRLFPPPVDLSTIPTNLPTGGWDSLTKGSILVSVPGTVEGYVHSGNGPAGDYRGVSWWVRRFAVPETTVPRRLLLRFDSVRLRAEVFLNRRLAGYDLVGNTPFDVDLSGVARPGEDCELAVRITDPGGNFDWRDSSPFQWGTNTIPMSHGFGGITGRLRLISCDPVCVDDLYIQNTPAVTAVNVFATLLNATTSTQRRTVTFAIRENAASLGDPVFLSAVPEVELRPGTNVVTFKASVPAAKLWSLEHPNLYVGEVVLQKGDAATDLDSRTFGFRWFAPDDVGSNAVFRLNGRRIVLRTAISWGFWPGNGIFPTPELAAKEVRVARELGQNMLNFHRTIGHPEILEQADEQGLLFYEEPGAYVNGARSPLAGILAREKLFRLVRRDRSHPSLVIYNLINEAWENSGSARDPSVLESQREDMRAAHALDPSRTMTYTSAWAKEPDADEIPKMHLRPFDDTIHMHGWFDNHHAGGPEVWRQNLYKSPENYYNFTTNRGEIVYWGEEGAISTPPRLEKIKASLDATTYKGWDGYGYLDWYREFDEFITRKDLRAAFPSVEALTTSLGNVSLYHQGRKIETIRLNDVTDGYAVNGWEAELVENHSGIVDCFRNPKGDPAIMARYNRPLYVAVKLRSQFAQIPGSVTADFFVINEKDVKGSHDLRITARRPDGSEVFSQTLPVTVTGGEVYGELLRAGVEIPIAGATGMFKIEASLREANGPEVAAGSDDVLAVDWRDQSLPGAGAVWESAGRVSGFLEKSKGIKAEPYRDDLGKLAWVVVARPPGEGAGVEIPGEHFRKNDEGRALTTTFYEGTQFDREIYQRTDNAVDFSVPDGATPAQAMSVMENYGVRWGGTLIPPEIGDYMFSTESSGGTRLIVAGQTLFDTLREKGSQVNRGHVRLQAGEPVELRLEFWHNKGTAQCRLLWAVPEAGAPDAAKLLARVRDEGTRLIILDRAETWMPLLGSNTPVRFSGSFKIGTAWLGGLHFVKAHPLFDGLPVNTAMDWPYQSVVRNGKTRSGLELEGEELVAGAWHSYPMALGTAVGVIRCGKGEIIVSTLEIAGQVQSSETSAEVARKLLCNFISQPLR